jgi:hypothetical protein
MGGSFAVIGGLAAVAAFYAVCGLACWWECGHGVNTEDLSDRDWFGG